MFDCSDFPWSVDHRFLLLDRDWNGRHFAERKLPTGRIFARHHGSPHFAHSQRLSTGIHHHRRCWNILGNHNHVLAPSHGVHRYQISCINYFTFKSYIMLRLLLFFIRNQLIFGIWVKNVRIESGFFTTIKVVNTFFKTYKIIGILCWKLSRICILNVKCSFLKYCPWSGSKCNLVFF